MNLNPPRAVRAVLYLIGTLGLIALQWATEKGWLDSPDRTAIAAVLALIMLLATANTVAPEGPADRRRDERGRAAPMLALLAAAVLAIAGGLVAVISSPAHAYGWSDARCDYQPGNAARVCFALHTSPSGNGLRVDQSMVCAWKKPQLYYNGFQGTRESTVQFWGSGGNYLGFINLAEASATVDGNCAYTNSAFQMGNQACYHEYGQLVLAGFDDDYYSIDGKVTGGAC